MGKDAKHDVDLAGLPGSAAVARPLSMPATGLRTVTPGEGGGGGRLALPAAGSGLRRPDLQPSPVELAGVKCGAHPSRLLDCGQLDEALTSGAPGPSALNPPGSNYVSQLPE